MIQLKRVATIQVPENERSLCLRQSPQWIRTRGAARAMQMQRATLRPPDAHNNAATAPEPPPAHVHGEWSRRIWTLKHQLDHPPYVNMWNVYKQYTNDYERIHVSSNRSRIEDNVAAYLPLSRSYFKMWELLKDFGLLGGCADRPSLANTSLRTAHLAEGPGGFIEAVCRYRKDTATDTVRRGDRYFGITLKPTRRDVPGWSKSIRLLREYTQIHRHHGADGTGCLYKVANIHKLVSDVGRNSCSLVTGDGGIDFSVDFALQEPLSLRLLTAQIYAGLLLLHPGKAFVCKFFDMHEPATHELLWVLATTFDKIHIVKPVTSRLANSERYIVGVRYRGCPEPLEKLLCTTLMQWRADHQLVTIMQAPVPDAFVQSICAYNEWYAEQQHTSIQACLQLIDMAVSNAAQDNPSDTTQMSGSVQDTDPDADADSASDSERSSAAQHISGAAPSKSTITGDSVPSEDGWSTCVSRKRRPRAATAAVTTTQRCNRMNTLHDVRVVPAHRMRRRPTQNAVLEAKLEDIVQQQQDNAREWCKKYGVEMV